MAFDFDIPTQLGTKKFSVEPGNSLYFVGANGGGKTRLAVTIEELLGHAAHRISAHRALVLNPEVAKVSQSAALRGLRYGYAGPDSALNYRSGHRWEGKAAVKLLNDYDFLIQALFADQANTSLETHKNARAGNGQPVAITDFEKLVKIWDRVLPHRQLDITGDDIKVSVTGNVEKYAAPEMSDGERAVFYLIGQTLTAAENSLIIFDEPELHIHRSIIATLWDELEAARSDCGMVIISHDLEFVSSRQGQKYVLSEYAPLTGWRIEDVPEDSGFTEELTTLILGSRKPVLFVEGNGNSLDKAIYRACYPNWLVIPRGSCSEVLHAVVTMRANAALTRVHCAGIVDADDYSELDARYMKDRGIEILPVSEIENLFLLPNVIEAIAMTEGFYGQELQEKVNQLLEEILAHASVPKNQRDSILQYSRRRIDRELKKIDLSGAQDVSSIDVEYKSRTAALDIQAISTEAETAIRNAIDNRDMASLLKWYNNKGLLVIATKAKGTSVALFEQWVTRSLRNGSAPMVSAALRFHLPEIH